ncbi:hypothetical protein L7F22_011282 [Adiantum nelumboides]|nr:hypothetical protein [Adiantum nelumboides]
MKEPRGRKRYVSLLRKRANVNWRDLMSATSTAKFKLLRKDRMRLRRKNSFQASKLLRSLRSSAPSKHESKVRSHLRSFDSPETLTKKGKSSRVSERSIDKVSSSPPVAQDEREEGEVFAINRRMTRGMDGVKMKTTMTVDAPICRVLKRAHAEKIQNQGKSTRRAGLKNSGMHEGNMETDNASYTGKLKHQESIAKEDKLNKRVHKVAFSLDQGYASKSLIRLDTNRASKSLSQAQALSKSPKNKMSEGVTTRQKAGSTTHVQPPRGVKREAKWSRHTRGIRSPDLNKNSNTGGAHEVERKPKRTFSRGMQDDAEDRFSPGDAHPSTDSQLDSEVSRKGGSWSASSERSRKRKTVNELDDPRQLDIGKGRLSLGRSPEIASEQGPAALGKLIESAVKLRRSKRKRSPTRSDYLTDRQKGSQKDSKGIGGKVEYATFQDTKNLEQPYDVTEEKSKSSHAVAENETPSNLEALRMDPSNKSCLVATSPTETGGRQMRPRPLDLEQPLLVLVEGLDEEYYEFDGGSFHRMLGQQPEVKSSCPGQAKLNGSIRKVLHALDPAREKVDSIVIPSFRVCEESEGSLQHSGLPYILPDSYVTTGFSVENQHVRLCMNIAG